MKHILLTAGVIVALLPGLALAQPCIEVPTGACCTSPSGVCVVIVQADCENRRIGVYLGDGTQGRACDGPYDAILVTAGGPVIPAPLLSQLAPGGRLVGPFGERGSQELVRIRKRQGGAFVRESLGPCRFVDLIGEHGWAAA